MLSKLIMCKCYVYVYICVYISNVNIMKILIQHMIFRKDIGTF